MKLVKTEPVEIGLRMLGDDDRRKVWAWIEHLANWETDAIIREHSRLIDPVENLYLLTTNTEYRVFFRLEDAQIVLLDIASESTLRLFSTAGGKRGQ